MKLFSAAILASAAATAMGQMTPAQLETRWDMDEPNITYSSSENKFTLDFLTASPNNTLYTGLQEEFYDVNCKDDGSGFPEIVVDDLFFNPDPAKPGRPQMTLNGPGGVPQLEFIVDTQGLANNPYIYEVVGETGGTCPIGQYYNITLDVNITVNLQADAYPQDIIMQVMEAASGEVVYTSNPYSQFETINEVIPDLCRGVDYIFNYTDTYGDGLYTGGGVSGTYMSADTPDVIFYKASNEIDYGFLSLFNLPLNPQNPATNIQDRDGQGMMKFCVRSSLGYSGQNNQNETLAWQITNNFQEVNFIESLITIFFDLSAGFSVLEFNVDPKERIETTVQKDTYELEAWLCDLSLNYEITSFPLNPNPLVIDKEVPSAIDSTFLATEPEASASYFNQGALITVCVAPDDAAWQDGIRMNGLNFFDWERNDLATTSPTLVNPGPIIQPAIAGGAASVNGLTSYAPATCLGGQPFCTFSSILFADFYISRGVASGAGSANLVFATPGNRRLGAPEDATARKLQEDEVAESPFDVSVPVDLTDTGPAGLKTAGGASYGISALASALALLGAALMA